MTIGLTRRALLGTGAAGAVGVMASGSRKASAVSPSVSPITMVINQSPWFGGFRQLVELYGKETGNTITLDVNPYAGALEKVRNSLQANEGMYDLLAIDNNWMLEMFAGGFLIPPQEVDPDFKLYPNVSTYGDTIYWNSERKLFGRSNGKLMGVPINGNVQVLFYG
jgi:multiple sugar transport system substrate-binding protein